jgi:hypothetical protein
MVPAAQKAGRFLQHSNSNLYHLLDVVVYSKHVHLGLSNSQPECLIRQLFNYETILRRAEPLPLFGLAVYCDECCFLHGRFSVSTMGTSGGLPATCNAGEGDMDNLLGDAFHSTLCPYSLSSAKIACSVSTHPALVQALYVKSSCLPHTDTAFNPA